MMALLVLGHFAVPVHLGKVLNYLNYKHGKEGVDKPIGSADIEPEIGAIFY